MRSDLFTSNIRKESYEKIFPRGFGGARADYFYPPSPKQTMAFAFTLAPNTHNTDLITTAGIATATTITRTNIGGINGSGGTGTIIDTITIETMIGTMTGIDVERYFLHRNIHSPQARLLQIMQLAVPPSARRGLRPTGFLCFPCLRRK